MSISSRIALGCDSKLFKLGGDITPIMEKCEELGLYIFDTARLYGESERVLGEYIRSHGPREKYFVISKGCHPYPWSRLNPRCLVKDLNKSLKILDIGYIDLYLLHRDDKNVDLKAIIKILDKYQKEGKIKHYGVSNWTKERIIEFNKVAKELGCEPVSGVSNNFTLIPWVNDPWGGGDGCVSFSDDKEAIEFMIKNNLPLYSYSPLGRGFLTGRGKANVDIVNYLDSACKRAYLSKDNINKLSKIEKIAEKLGLNVPQLTLAYLANHKMNVIPVVATTSIERLEENASSVQIKLDDKIMQELENL